ncbi:MAG: SUMF1/EgtB/PvdO family nonheme iron enzyme [Chthoniobacterales bacterium]
MSLLRASVPFPLRALHLAAFLCVCVFASDSRAQPLVSVETVAIGNPGNATDGTTGFGAVSNAFKIGKFEVTIGQYTAFLNAVARTNPNSYIVNLWNGGMMTNPTVSGIHRTGGGTTPNPYNYASVGNTNQPVAYVSWFDAARFANWLHNGATNGASTETGAYTLNGATNGVLSKNVNAIWWIPSENEWV